MHANKQLATIAWWEFKRFFKWKQELISIALLIIIFSVSAGWGVITELFSEQHNAAIFYENKAEQQWRFEASEDIALRDAGSMEVDTWQNELPENVDALIIIQPDLQAKMIVRKRDDWQDSLSDSLSQQLHQARIEALAVTPEQRKVIDQAPDVETVLQASATAKSESDDSASEALPMLVTISITVGVFTGFGLMMMSITAEKQQRVTEQLLTIIGPKQWMDGKILGITLHSLKSMVFIGLFFAAMAIVASAFSGGGDSAAGFDRYYGAFLSVIFVLLGLLLINSMLAGFSATIDDPNHSSRSSVMLLPLLPVFLSFSLLSTPDSGLAQVMSILPISSFVMMPVRLLQTDVVWWQQLLSLALLVVFVIWMRNVAGRLFTMGIQFYGKEPNWKDIWHAIKG